MSARNIETLFPRLKSAGYEVTSEETPFYNCIAWAADDDSRNWEPLDANGYYWPEGLSDDAGRLETWTSLFEQLGFADCGANSAAEPGFDKVVIYANQYGTPKHVAWQTQDGQWASKLGMFEDIVHSLDGLCSVPSPPRIEIGYGEVARVLKRPAKPRRCLLPQPTPSQE